VNRRFQAKLVKWTNTHIIKNTASIPTKFCTSIKTTKCHSRVVWTHTKQIQDGGQPPSWKNRKKAISRPRFDWFRPNLAQRRSSTPWTVRPLKIWNFKNPRQRRPPSWKIEKWPYLGRGLTDFDHIWHGNAVRPSWAFRPLYFQKFNGPVVHPKNYKRLCMGDKVPPCSLSNILDSWLRTVKRISLSCTAIQAESNELFGVIIKRLSRYLESIKGTVFAVFLEMSSCRGCGGSVTSGH